MLNIIFLTIIAMPFIYLIGACLWSIISMFIPPIILLPGLRRSERKQVIEAWKDLSARYPILKKLQIGIFTSLRVTINEDIYGRSKQIISAFHVLKFAAQLGINKGIANDVFFIPDYYDFTIHELTHSLTKVLIPSFREHLIFATGKTIEHKNSQMSFIEGVMTKYNFTPEDIWCYVSRYAGSSEDWGEVLSESMWKYMKMEKNPKEKELRPETFEVVNTFITEFDRVYAAKVKR